MPNPLRALAVLSFSMSRRCSNFPFFSLVAMVVLLGACSNRQVKVEMQAGTEGPERIFETNRADRDEIGRLSETYEAAPSTRAGGKDGVRLLAKGELTAKVSFLVAGASKGALEAVEKTGGKVELIEVVPAAEKAKAKKGTAIAAKKAAAKA